MSVPGGGMDECNSDADCVAVPTTSTTTTTTLPSFTTTTAPTTTTTLPGGCPQGCDDANPCTADVCVNNMCVYAALPDDTPCPGGTCQDSACIQSSTTTIEVVTTTTEPTTTTTQSSTSTTLEPMETPEYMSPGLPFMLVLTSMSLAVALTRAEKNR